MSNENNLNSSNHRETVLYREIDIELNVDVQRMLAYYRVRDYKKYIELQSEYQELKNAFESAKGGVGGLTKKEFKKLQDEVESFENIIKKSEKENLKLEKKLVDKDIGKLDDKQLKYLLAYTNSNYKNKEKGGFFSGVLTKVGYLDNGSLRNIKDKTQLNKFQEDIIGKILKSDKGYSPDGRLASFHKSKGNFITNVRNVESAIGKVGVQKVEGKAIANYLNYLEGTNKLNLKYLHTLGKKNVKDLFEYYKNHKGDDEFKNVSSSISSVLENISNRLEDVKDIVVEKASEMFKNIDKFVNNLFLEIKDSKDLTRAVNSIDKFNTEEEKNYYIQALKRNIEENRNQLRYMFLREIKIQGLSDKEKNKRVDELIKALISNLSVSKLPEYKKLIENFNKDNGANVSANNSSKILSNIIKRKNKIEKIAFDEKINELMKKLGEARKKGDKKSISILESELMAKKRALAGIAKSESDIRGLEKVTSKIDIDKFNSSQIEQKIIDVRKIDKEFDDDLKKEEAIQKKLDSEIKKYEQDIKPEADKKDKSEKVNKESEKNNNIQKEIYEGKTYNVIKNESGDTTAYTGIIGTKKISILASELTGKEKEDLENNPEKIKNFVEFKSFLEETGLGFMWKFRDKLKNQLSQRDNFYDYEDGLSTKEQLEILNFIGERLGFKYSEDINHLKEQFEEKSKLSVFDVQGKKYENNSSKSSFEQALEGKLIDKGTWIDKPKKD